MCRETILAKASESSGGPHLGILRQVAGSRSRGLATQDMSTGRVLGVLRVAEDDDVGVIGVDDDALMTEVATRTLDTGMVVAVIV
jgi:hypothetical protein